MTVRFFEPLNEFDRMFDRLAPTAAGSMPMDIFEKDGTYHARFDLPGVDPETVELTVENSILTVTVERPVEDTEGANWLMRERPAGRHSRQIRLGPLVDTGNVDAAYDRGVLTVTLPMREEAKPQRIAIKSTLSLPE
ncbi:MAG: Hsp20/alpha crystallin family protein [Actinobacteria bacterium]|nr:Hsp20/alpha crystallin family protein [Actinomycetota bacterium]